jgi:hypothetical protein
MECARVSKTIFAPGKIASLAVTLSSCRWLGRHVLSMVGALPHQPKPGHYFNSDIDASLLTPSSVAAELVAIDGASKLNFPHSGLMSSRIADWRLAPDRLLRYLRTRQLSAYIKTSRAASRRHA